MASSSHRKCQYQGEGCMGTAHAGHDQCAHCYFQFIKPALLVERADVKRRRALKKRGHPTEGIMDNNARQDGGTLGYLDLDEDLKKPVPPKATRAIANAIFDVQLDHLLEGKTEEQQLDIVFSEMLKDELKQVPPVVVKPLVKSPPKEEPPVQPLEPEREENDYFLTRYVHAGGQNSHLTEAQVKEVIDAYEDDSLQVKDICDSLNIATTTLYAILRDAELPLRTTRPYRDRLDKRLAPLRKEPVMPQSTPPVSNAKVEPPPPNGVVPGLTEWVVTYTVVSVRTETTIVAAKSFNDAAAAVTDGDVISVAKKLP